MLDEGSRTGRAYAYSHSYRDPKDREPSSTSEWIYGFSYLEDATRVPLPPATPSLLADSGIENAFDTSGCGRRPTSTPYVSRLATLLHLNVGLLKADLRDPRGFLSLHRAVPTPGSLGSSELFVYVPVGVEIPEGLYHYDILRHELALVRSCNVKLCLEQALARPLDDPEAVLIVGSVFWRLGQKYTNFSYRVASLEAGHLIGNVLLTGAALGWHGTVHYLFDDDLVEKCLGLPHLSAGIMAMLPLYGSGTPNRVRPPSLERRAPGFAPEPIRGKWRLYPRENEEAPRSVGVEEIEKASRKRRLPPPSSLDTGDQDSVSRWTVREAITLPMSHTPQVNLLEAIQGRNSGSGLKGGISPMPAHVPFSLLTRVLRHAARGYANDVDAATPTTLRRVRLVVAPNRVQGLEPGAYYYRAGRRTLHQITARPFPARALYYKDTINGSALSIVWGVLANYDTAFTSLGDRGYRIVNMEAGILAQRICLLSAAGNLFARPFCGFDETNLDSWLGLGRSSEMPIYLVLSGYNRAPGFRFSLSPW